MSNSTRRNFHEGSNAVSVAVVPGYDVTHSNLPSVPHDGVLRALYVTGSPQIQATPADLAANPGCLEIDQSPVDTALDEKADALDFENGAAGPNAVAPWAKAAMANFKNGARPGQRSPVIYMSRNNVHTVVNALIAGGVTSGIGLWIADWQFDAALAQFECANGDIGPFPIKGIQYSDQGGGGAYDLNFFNEAWTKTRSGHTPPPPPPPHHPPPPGTGEVNVTLNSVPYRELKQGDSDNAFISHPVRFVQSVLAGYYKMALTIDGSYGPVTAGAVRTLQHTHALPGTGVMDAKTWELLFRSPAG